MAEYVFGNEAGRLVDDRDECRAIACDAPAVIASFQLPLCEFHIIESYRQATEYIRLQSDRGAAGAPISPELPTVREWVKLPFGVCPSCDRLGLRRDKVHGDAVCAHEDCDYTATREEFDALCQKRIDKASAQQEVVYYIRFGDRVKIGTTKNLADRIAHIPHDEVMATEPGGVYVERQRHEQFRHLRARVGKGREWFRLTPELAEHIAAVKSRQAA